MPGSGRLAGLRALSDGPQALVLEAAGASWRFEQWPDHQAAKLLSLWTEGFVPLVPCPGESVPLRIVYDADLACPEDGSATLFSQGRVLVKRAGTDWWVQGPDILVRIPSDRSAAYLCLAEAFSAQPLKLRQSALLLPMMWLLQAAGYTVLHAATVLDPAGGSAVLLAGGSGSGKSTTLASLCDAGWQLLADDVSICRIGQTAAWVWPLVCGLSLRDKQFVARPGWRRLDTLACEGKTLLEPPRVANRPAPLAAVVLPCVSTSADSTLCRLGGADGIVRLLPATGGVTLEPQFARRSLDALGWLAANIPVHDLRLGSDAYGDGARLGSLLAPLLQQPALLAPA